MLYAKHGDPTKSGQRIALAGSSFDATQTRENRLKKPLASLGDDYFVSASMAARKLLRKREIECLRWVAEGKTSVEISRIIDLSEHTVNHYLAACCRKLDAVNRVQAAVKAVRFGIV